jgi:hypothetical protein
MKKRNNQIVILLGMISTLLLSKSGICSDFPIYPILSNLDYIGKLHLLSAKPESSLYTKTTADEIEEIAKKLSLYHENKKNVESVINITNTLMTGTAHDQCVSKFYVGYVFAFDFLDSLSALQITKKEALDKLINLVSGEENLPRMTILALSDSRKTLMAQKSMASPDNLYQEEYDVDLSDHLNSKCFAEGALHGFELNFTNFSNKSHLIVQTSVKILIEQLFKNNPNLQRKENSCLSKSQEQMTWIYDRFLQFEINISNIENQIKMIQSIEEKTRNKFIMEWRVEFIQFQENLRELKNYIFVNLTSKNLAWEEKANIAIEMVKTLNINRKILIKKKFESLKVSYDKKRGEGLYIRLVRKSEQLFELYEEKIQIIVQQYLEIFRKGRYALEGTYMSLLDVQAMKLNEMFWNLSTFEFRNKKEKECDDDYLKYLSKTRKDSSVLIQNELKDKDKWLITNVEEHFELTIKSFIEREEEISRSLIQIWEKFEYELEMIWEYKEETVDNFFSCKDPVREWLNELYSEFIALEIDRTVIEKEIIMKLPDDVDEEDIKTQVEEKYSKVVEIIRTFKAKIDESIWVEMRGSMDHIDNALESWELLVIEMKEQWSDRTQIMKEMLLTKGLSMETIQNAIRKHDNWLEEVEKGDQQLKEIEFRDYYSVSISIRTKIRRFFIKVAKEINLMLWTLMAKYEVSEEHFEMLISELKKELSKLVVEIKLVQLKEELISIDQIIFKKHEEISKKQIEYWTQALIDNEEFWYKIGESIDEGNNGTSVEINELICKDGDVMSRAVKPVNLEFIYKEFISNELQLDTVLRIFRKYSESIDFFSKSNRNFSLKRYNKLISMLRTWKADQYDDVLSVYLSHEVQFEDFSIKYGEIVNKYLSLWRETETNIKTQWLKINRTSSSIDRLSTLFEYQMSKWNLKYQENDQRVSLLMEKLWIFHSKLRELFITFSTQMNESLFMILEKEVKKVKNWSNPEESIDQIWVSTLEKTKTKLVSIKKEFLIEIKQIYVEIEINFEHFYEIIDKSFEVEFKERLIEVETELNKLRPHEPEIDEFELICPERTIEALKWPLEKTFEMMIYNEVQLTSLENYVEKLNLDHSLEIMRKIKSVHSKWIEVNREYKAKVFEKVIKVIIESNSEISEMLYDWDELVESSILTWERTSKYNIEDQIGLEDSTSKVEQIKIRTEQYIRSALELDEQLKLFYFGKYLEEIDSVEKEVRGSAMKLSKELNLQFMREWKDFGMMVNQSNLPVENNLPIMIKNIVVNIEYWLKEDSPTIESKLYEESIAIEIEKILSQKAQIINDHQKLWELLNKKFQLTGPQGSLEEFWDEDGNCDIFKIIKRSKKTISQE